MFTSPKPTLKEVFFCPEESDFYSQCLEALVFNDCSPSEVIVEFGSGDGNPVIKSLVKTRFDGIVHGFELNKLASETANSTIKRYGLGEQYIIHNGCLFEAPKLNAKYLVSNPPYLPAVDNNIYQPLLHGGIDGITIAKELLELGYENVLVMVSSYSNPKGLIDFARTIGYCVSKFIVSPLEFGYYSSDPKVIRRIEELRKSKRAFYSRNIYLLAGVLFTKQQHSARDLSTELIQLMTCL